MFDMQKVGERIAALRRKANMTQTDLAEWLGISYQAVSSWERGATMPDISKLLELSRALHTTVDALLSGSEDETHEATESTHAEKNADKSEPAETAFDGSMQDAMAQQVEEVACGDERPAVTIRQTGKNKYVIHIAGDDAEKTKTKGKVSAEALGSIACHMDQDMLEDCLADAINDGDEDVVAEIACYMEADTIDRAVARAHEKLTAEMISELGCYMGQGALEKCLVAAINDGDEDIVDEIACYLEPETIDRAVAKAQEAPTTEMVEELAMYMGNDALEECMVQAINEGNDEMVEEVACHLDDDVMVRVLERCTGEMTLEIVESLACNASEAALDLLIEKCDLEDADVIEALSPYLNRRQLRTLMQRLRNG